ncbi:DUF1223 domain-containing protein [Neptunomonas japonica]|uniref:DUF1223 domain-containing protein n=1 Tax=Neptunomonas japonica JAMM 1380 TaxID=1441457 RepID=A0A7R6PKZ1_9GAMM|nr:DUF1223 domain-containing protein [Neptunomonas japonica]BBB28392.1 conserved hypothetical protein [Neptunomonas japonica JAMM 1380]
MTHPSIYAGLILMASAALPISASASQLFEQSGDVPQLIELYTSEGCSSCPPADRNLSTLLKDPELWTKRLPVAFHVDYWDYIGWKDTYAQPLFTERQYRLKKAGAINSIYTPGWVVDGKEWRGFFLGQDLPTAPARKGGHLSVNVNDNQQVSINYKGDSNSAPADVTAHLVLMTFDQRSQVTSGENKGKNMLHNFVAVQKEQVQLPAQSVNIPLSKLDISQRQALVVWLTAADSSQPLQATGGWLK